MRPQNLAKVVDSIVESTDDYRIVVIAEKGECADAAKSLGTVEVLEDTGGTWAQRINHGFRWTTEPYIFTAADDLRFTPGWFPAVMREMDKFPGSSGCIAVNDLLNPNGVHFVIARSYVNSLGGCLDEPGVVCHEGYRHAYVDDEVRATAIFHDRWGGVVKDAIVEHMHPGIGKAPTDEIYKIGEASMTQGLQVYASRAHLWQKELQ